MFLLRITQAFAKANLPYALVGGYAVALHGAIRGTIDVDLIITLDKESFSKAEKVLLNLGLQPRLPIHAHDLFQNREQYIQDKHLIAWSFVNANDLSECVDIIITEDLKNKTVETKQLGHQQVTVLSKPDLIVMKQKAARPQDIEDIKALEALL